jgi:hypothetical protein
MLGSLIVLVSLLVSLLLRPALAFEARPKFGPNAVPILAQTAFLSHVTCAGLLETQSVLPITSDLE